MFFFVESLMMRGIVDCFTSKRLLANGVSFFEKHYPRFFRKLKDEYLKEAQKVISDPNILINVVSRRVKQLKHGSPALVESLEKLNPEDVALREIIEGKITYQLYNFEDKR